MFLQGVSVTSMCTVQQYISCGEKNQKWNIWWENRTAKTKSLLILFKEENLKYSSSKMRQLQFIYIYTISNDFIKVILWFHEIFADFFASES